MKLFKSKLTFVILFIIPYIFLSLGLSNQPSSEIVIHRGNLYYLSHTVLIKLKSETGSGLAKVQSLTSELNTKLSRFKFSSSKEMFGKSAAEISSGLDRILLVKYNSQDDPFYVAAKIKGMNSNIEWAEPKLVRRLASVPDDPGTSFQYYLSRIQVENAWDISKGDTNVIIGIVDSGVDWPHPDLYPNIWHNWKDINSHWASDNDQIVGDSIGWDFGGAGDGRGNPTPDNNPMEDVPAHGTLVAGIASAATNNGIGGAGIAYKCKIMPVKAAEGDASDPTTGEPFIIYGFEGIKYAVDNGAKVINCSWGGGGYSNTEQAIINYATAKGALVIAAAGNDATNGKFYPASYNGVLSVAATDENDNVATYSNYGPSISLAAPGNGIFNTWQPNTYISYPYGYGTSFASPIVSGVAALVFAHFPNYTPQQVAEQVRVNCDNIDSLNRDYIYQVGKGRVNAYKALANSNSEAVRAVDLQYFDAAPGGNGNGIPEPGETISVGIKFMNYLRPIQNLNVSFVSMNSYATVNSSSFSASSIPTLDSLDNYNSKFSFTLSNSIPYDQPILFRLDYTDGNYSDFQLIEIKVNPSYLTESGNNVSLTLTSRGDLSFNDYPTNLEGDGFQFKNGGNLLFEGALMYGNSASTINDAARNGFNGNSQDKSFEINQPFKLLTPKNLNYQHGLSFFDDGNSATKLGIATRLDSYNFDSATDSNYIILKYSFTNNSQSSISNFYAGVYFDWDMIDGSGDSTFYDKTGNMGFVKHAASAFNTVTATALISSTNYGYWAIANDGSDGSFGVYDGFSSAEKWMTLSSGIANAYAGAGDISEVTSAGPFTIQPAQTLDVAFAVAAGNSITDLRTSIANARSKYQLILTDVSSGKTEIPTAFSLSQNYPNPFNPSTVIKYQIAKEGNVSLKIYDILGREVATLVNEVKPAGNYSVSFNSSSLGGRYSSGIYFYQIRSGSYVDTKKMILLK